MTTLVENAFGREAISDLNARLNLWGSAEYVVPKGNVGLGPVASQYSTALAEGPYNGFEYVPAASSGLTVHFDTGEALAGGYYMVSDDDTIQDSVTGDVLHDVTLPANEEVLVELRPDTRANTAATDRIIIEVAVDPATGVGAGPEEPDVSLYEFVTDGSGVVSVTDVRPTTFVMGPEGVRSVSGDSQRLGGRVPADYARTDIPEFFQQALGMGGGTPRGELGSAPGEVLRLGAGFSDVVIQKPGGGNRFTLAYNAARFADGWRIINPNDNCSVLGMNTADPGIDSGAIVAFGGFEALGKNLSEGDTFEFEWMGFDRGIPYTNGEQGLCIPRRTTPPPLDAIPPDNAMLWYDADGGTLKFTYELAGGGSRTESLAEV